MIPKPRRSPARNNDDADAANSSNSAAPQSEPQLPLERIGDVLRRERERRGDHLQQIADALCIRRSYLEAIEESRYEEFPADAYVIGFLRSYATYMKMNGKDAIESYRQEMAGRRKKPALSMPTPITEGRTPSGIIMVVAGIVALLIYALWYGFSTSDRTAVSTPPALPSTAVVETSAPLTTTVNATLPTTAQSVAPVATPTVPLGTTNVAPAPVAVGTTGAAVAAAPAVTTQPVTTPVVAEQAPLPLKPDLSPASSSLTPASDSEAVDAAPAGDVFGGTNKGSRITIRADKTSWVMVTDSKGKSLFDHVLKEGDVYKVPDQAGLTLATGNTKGISLILDGVEMPRLSAGSSKVMKGVLLDPQSLKALPPNPQE